MTIAAGTRFGPYEIVEAIGSGGMGEVYRATDTNLKRDVAVKVLPESLAGDADRLARFQREAEVLASLDHPNIAHVFGLETAGGRRALVMELVQGPTLAERLERGPLAVDDALAIATQIANALEGAHSRGIVHRDLKPANVKLRPDGTVKVLDFGIARALETRPAAEGADAPALTTPAMTEAGLVLGTAAYMSPEQARGKPVDTRVDIWAFGCVLYEMLTGQPAFGAEDVTTTLARVLERDADLRALPEAVTPAVARTIEFTLQKDVNRRIADIRDVKLALYGAFDAPPGRDGPRGGLTPLAALGAVGAALLIGGAAASWMQSRLPADAPATDVPAWATGPIRFPLYAPEGTTFGGARLFAVSPDGRLITFTAQRPNEAPRLWVRSLDADLARELPGSENAGAPFWSPDGDWIGFFANNALKRVRSDGSASSETITRLAAFQTGLLFGTWGADGVIVFQHAAGQGLSRVSVRDGAVTTATVREGDSTHFFPRFIGDTGSFIYNAEGVHLGSLDGGQPRLLLEEAAGAGHMPGYLLYAGRDDALLARPFDEKVMEFTGAPFRVLDEIPVAGTSRIPVSVSSNGVLAYRTRQLSTLGEFRWVDRAGTVSELLMSPGRYGDADWSLAPGDDRVAVRRVSDGGVGSLWILNLERGGEQPVTLEGDSMRPLWSADGERIVFGSARDRPPDLFVKDLNDNTEELLTGGPQALFPESWDRTRDWLVYGQVDAQSGADLWRLALDDREPQPLPINTPADETAARVSPNGRWIAYTSTASGERRVVLAGFPSGQPRCAVSIDSANSARWRGDSRELYYVSGNRLVAVEVGSTEGQCDLREPVTLFPLLDTAMWGPFAFYTPAADGERFLFLMRPEQDEEPPPIRVILNWPALAGE